MQPEIPLVRQSITFKLTLAVGIFLILFQAVLALVVFVYFKREFKQTLSKQQQTLLTVVTQSIDQKLLASQRIVVDVARQLTPAAVADPEAAQRFLDNRPGTHSNFDNGLFLFSAKGTIIAESPYRDNRRGRDISFREYFIRTMSTGRPVISDPYVSTHTPGAPAIMFTAPVRDVGGQIVAVLGGSLNLQRDNFLGELSRTRVAESGYLYIVNRNRTMIMHPDKNRIMQSPEIAGSNALLDEAFKGFEGSAENVNSRGLHSLTSFRRFRSTDWIMGANFPLAEAYAPIYKLQRYLLAAVLFGSIVSILVIRLLMVRYTKALVRFAEHVRTISLKQNEERLFHDEAGGEIGILAGTFNAMIQREDQRNRELLHACTHDAMTGLYNRAFFDSELDRLSRSRIAPISIVVADIDGLKHCNDTVGHAAGDQLIKTTARVLLDSFRAEDIIARIGGDEFAVILPGVDAVKASQALDRVRSVEKNGLPLEGDCPFKISLGQATSETADGVHEAFKLADKHMYMDKTSHRKPFAE